MTDAVTECLPPDTTVTGLWWVHQEYTGWRVWLWWPPSGIWDTGVDFVSPINAAGWRAVAPAVPLGGSHNAR